MAGDQSVAQFLKIGRSQIGAPYRFWRPSLNFNEVQYMDPDKAPKSLLGVGANCSSLFNWILGKMGFSPIGGTGDYGDAILIWEHFNINKNYPPGTFLVCPYSDPVNQGHVVIVTTPEDLRTRNQWLLQSDTIEGVSADGLMGKPGVNEKRTMAQTQLWANFIWAGLLPGIPVLDGFPGYTASPQELADWTAEVMDWFGLPRYLFVNCSLTELTPIWNENRTHRDIRAIPGYTVPVDAHSQGPAQQQYDWWPFPYDFPTAVWSFATAMRAAMPDPVPTDKWGTARWIQAVQRSAFADGSNYAAKFDWAVELVGSQPKPVVPDWRRFGWIERHGPGGVKIYVGNDVSEAHWRRYGWMELHGPGGATFHGGDDASGRGDWRKFGWIERHGPGEIEVHKGDGSSEGPDWRRFGWIELHGPGGATFYRGEG